jgi:DNA topoisomerase-2
LMSIETIYQKKTQKEHILNRPDTYIGSIEKELVYKYVLNRECGFFEGRTLETIPGLFKIFDEILVNATDNTQRDHGMGVLKVNINEVEGSIRIYNDGKGIPVELHKEENVYVPEMVFGQLLTSSNYNDTQDKTTGGRNGFGAKLTNIFSRLFKVETYDHTRGLLYKQRFENNMDTIVPPVIHKKKKSKSWTSVTFHPDFEKFGITGFSRDIVDVFTARVYEVAAVIGPKVKVYLNDSLVTSCNSFQKFVALHFPPVSSSRSEVDEPNPYVYVRLNERWEFCVALSDGQPRHCSFVNGIATSNGGKHVAAISDQVAKLFGEHIAQKHKGLKLTSFQVRTRLWVFVNCLISNPAFASQTKETLTTPKSKFGSSCLLDAKAHKRLLDPKHGLITALMHWATSKVSTTLKKSDGAKKAKLTGIPKLEDANEAGTKNSHRCTLILTEGDSAKALAVSGLSVVGRNRYGVFPLKGKLLNVRETPQAIVSKNSEISNLKQIIGLKQGVVYSDTRALRYGRVMFMTDQDHDGSHIKGLLINLFATFWPSLLELNGFLVEFVTPIVKATKGALVRTFYTMTEYETWKTGGEYGATWRLKYYKGLGTSTSKEAKEYFSQMHRHCIAFKYSGKGDYDALDKAFNKKKADARKSWLEAFVPGTFVDQTGENKLGYQEFVDKELIHFSMASNIRAIPNLLDGLKPGQRKILFACFKRRLVNEIKVAQLAGYVSEHSAYHHGEASLTATIIHMAQNFTGSNNINLLLPAGQFGTRHQGGKDSASARYIFTALSPITRIIFPINDDSLLTTLKEDGLSIEPTFYLPIVPMVLINGSVGIGSGWSTSIPSYNPRDVIANVRRLIDGTSALPMEPYVRGFKGTIRPHEDRDGVYTTEGVFEVSQTDKHVLTIDELPVGTWTEDYIHTLEQLVRSSLTPNGPLKRVVNHSDDKQAKFVVTVHADALEEFWAGDVKKTLKLTTNLSTKNMILFNAHGRLQKYNTSEAILQEFYAERKKLYTQRKIDLVRRCESEHARLTTKVQFISAVVSERLVVRNVKKERIVEGMQQLGLSQVDGYDYLLNLPLWNLTAEKIVSLQNELQQKTKELQALKSTSEADMWRADLSLLEAALDGHDPTDDSPPSKSDGIKRNNHHGVDRGDQKKPRLK